MLSKEKYQQVNTKKTKKPSLTHGDFDPANILVDNINNKWQITGILDWELAYSSSIESDLSNMLRYSDFLPQIFEDNFIKGIESNNLNISQNWKSSIKILDLLFLLDLLSRTKEKEYNKKNRYY